MTWVNLALLCRGDPKFDSGCGGFELYALSGILVLAPVFLVSLAAAIGGSEPRHPGALASLAVMATFVAFAALRRFVGREAEFSARQLSRRFSCSPHELSSSGRAPHTFARRKSNVRCCRRGRYGCSLRSQLLGALAAELGR
jgi:hypothetical protein